LRLMKVSQIHKTLSDNSILKFLFNYIKVKTVKTRTVIGIVVMMIVMVLPANAGVKGELQKYFSNVASKVKASDNVSEKREILNESFQTMSKALDRVEGSGLISQNDRAGINRIRTSIQEKQDELTGVNGYERVTDAQLNAFSNYVVQDMEQADVVISVSLIALILIIILIVLIVK